MVLQHQDGAQNVEIPQPEAKKKQRFLTPNVPTHLTFFIFFQIHAQPFDGVKKHEAEIGANRVSFPSNGWGQKKHEKSHRIQTYPKPYAKSWEEIQ